MKQGVAKSLTHSDVIIKIHVTIAKIFYLTIFVKLNQSSQRKHDPNHSGIKFKRLVVLSVFVPHLIK